MTNPSEQLPVKVDAIDSEQFGELIKLPDVLKQNRDLRARGEKLVGELLARMPENWNSVTLEYGDSLDADLNSLQGKMSTAVEKANERRSGFTRFFTSITKMFTAEENAMKELGDKIQAPRIAWASEKIRRQRERDIESQKELAKKHEGAEIFTNVTQAGKEKLVIFIGEQISKLNQKFNSQTMEELPGYSDRLKNWIPTMKDSEFERIVKNGDFKAKYHSPDEYAEIYNSAILELRASMYEEYFDALDAERKRLIELVNSRIEELKRAAQSDAERQKMLDRLETEENNRIDAAAKRKIAIKQQAQLSFTVAKDNATLEVASKAEELITKSPGSGSKLKYKPATHAEFLLIVQYWMESIFPAVPLDELEVKLSFMITACNKHLNDNIAQIRGIPVVEDISVKAVKTKKAKNGNNE
jgi:hemerythrin